MPLRLTWLERVLAVFNLLPVPLLDAPLATGIGKALVVACELGVFDELAGGSLTLEELAKRVRCSRDGLHLLLSALVSAGYLRKKQGTYRNSRMARRWLCGGSTLNIAPYVLHSPDIVALWDRLPAVVREGRQVTRMPYEEDASKPEMAAQLERHYLGLAALGLALGREIVARVHVTGNARRLLDVGGSHAAYSVLFCRKYPQLEALVVDLQVGIEVGKRISAQAGLAERIHFFCADIVRDDFVDVLPDSGGYDIALYFHIAHLLPPEINAALLGKVAQTLRPGGLLVFVDQVTDSTYASRLASLMVEFMALTMMTVGGTCYPFGAVKSWLEQAGMSQVRHHRLFMPGATFITARKG